MPSEQLSTSSEKSEHQEAQKSKPRLVDYWNAEVQRSLRRDSPWFERAKKVVDTYRGIYDDNFEVFNILWANTETLKPAVYNNPPVPEVERTHLEKDEIGNIMAIVMERTLKFCLDLKNKKFDTNAKKCRDDMLIPGRGVLKVVYDAQFEEEVVQEAVFDDNGDELATEITEDKKIFEEAWAEYVYWKDFTHSQGKEWDQVWWIAFAKDMNREQLIDEFGEEGKNIPLAGACYDNKHYYDEEGNFDYAKVQGKSERYARVWEIWDKDTREVIIISEGYSEIIDKYEDPYSLDGFFPTPEPLYSIGTTGSLVPVPEYTMYQYQAEELNTITRRITRLTEGLKARGIGDAEIKSLTRLFDGEDNQIILDEEYSKLMQSGGIDNAISWAPIEKIAQVLVILQGQRKDCLAAIYEITGIADIMRGASGAYDTAKAVEKKSQYGSVRVRERQRSIEGYFCDTIQIMGDVIAELFDPETLIIMSGVENNPILMQGMEEVMAALKDEKMRHYKISIQTGSTISQTDFERKEELHEFFGAISALMQQLIPAVEKGILPMEVAKEFLLYAARRFDVGRELQGALDQIGQQPEQPQGEEGQEGAAEQDAMLQMAQLQAQIEREKIEQKREEAQMDFQIDQIKLQLEAAKLQMELQSDDADRQVKVAIAMIDLETVKENARGGDDAN